MMETVITAIVDEFPMLRIGKRKIIFTGLLCIFLFLLGLPQCANVSRCSSCLMHSAQGVCMPAGL